MNRTAHDRAVPLRRLAVALVALAVTAATPSRAEELKKTGAVTIEQVQVAFIGSGNLGGGTLAFKGRNYPFTIGGLGIGGFGISKIKAKGEVYNLAKLSDFAGSYVQFRMGFAAGEVSTGGLWLKNSQGVVLQLEAERVGLALSLGGDAIYVKLD